MEGEAVVQERWLQQSSQVRKYYGHGKGQLTGICVEHLHNFARSRHRDDRESSGSSRSACEQWLFTLSDLMVLTTMLPRCTH